MSHADHLASPNCVAGQRGPPIRPPVDTQPRSFDGIEVAGLADAVDALKRISTPFLDWSGKAESLSFDVPTLPVRPRAALDESDPRDPQGA
jgi:hypothetical protein